MAQKLQALPCLGTDILSVNTCYHAVFLWFKFTGEFFVLVGISTAFKKEILCQNVSKCDYSPTFLIALSFPSHSLSCCLCPSILVIPWNGSRRIKCARSVADNDECVSCLTAAQIAFLLAANTFAVSYSVFCFCFMSATPNYLGVFFTPVRIISMSILVCVSVCGTETETGVTPAAPNTFSAFCLHSFTLHQAPSLHFPSTSHFYSCSLCLVWSFKVLKKTNFTHLFNYTAPRACVSVCPKGGGGEGKKRWTAEGSYIFV